MSLKSSGQSTSVAKFFVSVYTAFLDMLPQAAPLEPLEEVRTLIEETGLSQSDVARIYKTFQRLRFVDGHKLASGQPVLSSKALINAVQKDRDHVELLLRNILQLGGCYETVDWDRFIYVFVLFCSLTRVELCQLLFLIIIRELRGLEVHYLTSTQLDRFYERLRSDSAPPSMNCSKIHFSNFPLARYYATDFIEVCFLYSPLLNPILVLQRQFQAMVPSVGFWDKYDFLSGVNRKITLDFFLIRRASVSMTTSTAFQETCDLLLLSSKMGNQRGTIGRWKELDFLTSNRKLKSNEEVRMDKIFSKMPTEGLIRKNADIGKPV